MEKRIKFDLLSALLKQASAFLLASWLFWLLVRPEMPSKSFITVFLPYFLACFLLSLLSIAVTGIRFKILWNGTYKDRETYGTPDVYYTVAYLFMILIIPFAKAKWESINGNQRALHQNS